MGPLRKLTFGWLNEFIWVCQANPWTQEMNYDLPRYDGVEKNKQRLLKVFKRTKSSQTSMIIAYLPEFILYQLSSLFNRFITALAQKKTADVGAMINNGTLYQDSQAVLTFAWLLILSEGYRYIGKAVQGLFAFLMQRAAVAGRTVMYSILQDKIMSFSPLNSREVSEGFITNLIQVDSMCVDRFFSQVSSSIGLFLSTGVSFYFMVTAIEWKLSLAYVVAVIGIRVLFVLIFAAINYYQNRYLKAKDRRMDLLKNVLQNVDFVKTNSMENFFCLELYEKREEELMELRNIAFVTAVFEFFKRSLIKAPSLIIIILVVYLIPSKMSFSNYLFFLQLGTTLNQNISGLFDTFKFLITMIVSMKRIDKFLLTRERAPESRGYQKIKDSNNLVAVEVMAGNFKWRYNKNKGRLSRDAKAKILARVNSPSPRKNSNEKNNSRLSDQLLSSKYTVNSPSVHEENRRLQNSSKRDDGFNREEGEFYLTDVNLKIKKGETVVVLGKNCSGRSSFLYSLLGEMLPATEQSTVIVNGSIAFLSESRWLLGMSVKENIILGNEYSEERMNEALRCSQLEKDIENLQYGLETSVGDNGDTISGGQRTRIALARCFYQK